MNVTEVKNLFERTKSYYNFFTFDDKKIKEWHKILKNYDNEEVNESFDNYVENNEQPPLVFSLIRGLQKRELNQEDKIDYMKCEFCGKAMMIVNRNIEDFLQHERKCQKIGFINRMSENFRNKPIDKSKYYLMTDEELDNNYKQIMDYYILHRKESANVDVLIKRVGG